MEYTDKDFIINKHMIISRRLFEDKKLSHFDLCKLKHHYRILYSLFSKARNTDSIRVLREIGKQVEFTEFTLQKIWRFPQDKNYHRYWFKIPKCQCPKVDNEERVGTEYRIISESCKIHNLNYKKQ